MKNGYYILGLLLLSAQTIFCSTSVANFSIGGIIQEADGTPIENAKVFLSDDVFVFTDSEGKYLFSGLEAGMDYTVQATKEADHRTGITILDTYTVRHYQGPNNTTIDSLNSYDALISNLSGGERHDALDLLVVGRIGG